MNIIVKTTARFLSLLPLLAVPRVVQAKTCLMLYQQTAERENMEHYIHQDYHEFLHSPRLPEVLSSPLFDSENVRVWIYHHDWLGAALPNTVDANGNWLGSNMPAGSRYYITYDHNTGLMRGEPASEEEIEFNFSTVQSFLEHSLRDCLAAGFPPESMMTVFTSDGGGGLVEEYGGGVGGENTNEALSNAIRNALNNVEGAPSRLAVLGFDTGLMQTMGAANSYKDVANFIIASEAVQPGHGWAYNHLTNNSSPLELAQDIVSTFVDQPQGTFHKTPKLLSILNTTDKFDIFVEAFEELFAAIIKQIPVDSSLQTIIGRARSTALAFESTLDAFKIWYPSGIDIGSYLNQLEAMCIPRADSIIGAALRNTIIAYNDMWVANGIGTGSPHGSGMQIIWPHPEEYILSRDDWDQILFTNSSYLRSIVPNFGSFLKSYLSANATAYTLDSNTSMSVCTASTHWTNSTGEELIPVAYLLESNTSIIVTAEITPEVTRVDAFFGFNLTTTIRETMEADYGLPAPAEDDFLYLFNGNANGAYDGNATYSATWDKNHYFLRRNTSVGMRSDMVYVFDGGDGFRRIPVLYFPESQHKNLAKLNLFFDFIHWEKQGARVGFLTFSLQENEDKEVYDNITLYASNGDATFAISTFNEVPTGHGGVVVPIIYVMAQLAGQFISVIPGGINPTLVDWSEGCHIVSIELSSEQLLDVIPGMDTVFMGVVADSFLDPDYSNNSSNSSILTRKPPKHYRFFDLLGNHSEIEWDSTDDDEETNPSERLEGWKLALIVTASVVACCCFCCFCCWGFERRVRLLEVSKDGLLLAQEDLQDDKKGVMIACKQNGLALRYASPRLQNCKKAVLVACSQNGLALRYASHELRNDEEVVLAACSENRIALKYASHAMADNKDTVMAACSENGLALQYASDKLKDDKEVVLAACSEDGWALQYASNKLRDDKEVVLAACSQCWSAISYASDRLRCDEEFVAERLRLAPPEDQGNVLVQACSGNHHILKHASSHLMNHKEFVLAACWRNGDALKYASDEMKNTKDIVTAACLTNGGALKHASDEMKNTKDIVLAACRTNGHALQYASDELKNTKDIVLAACKTNGQALQYASDELKNCEEIVLAACSTSGEALQYASDDLKKNEEIVLAGYAQDMKALRHVSDRRLVMEICSHNGLALEHASDEIKNTKEAVLVACAQCIDALQYASPTLKNDKKLAIKFCSKEGSALKYLSEELKNDEETVLTACRQSFGSALQFATPEMRSNKKLVLEALAQNGGALKHASKTLKDDKDVVLLACSIHGNALQYASEALRGDKDIVMAAVESKPTALKFALGGLNQDRECLIKANLWDEDYHPDHELAATATEVNTPIRPKNKKIVLSTRFALAARSSAHATKFTVELKRHPYITSQQFVVYSPNAFNKSTCDPNWTDKDWPCRGTISTCHFPEHLKTGPPRDECCWRYSFRCHLQEASQSQGFMIQVVDKNKVWWQTSDLENNPYENHTLGDGQAIETEMAQDVGIKVFQFFEPLPSVSYTNEVDKFVNEIIQWYQSGCKPSDGADCGPADDSPADECVELAGAFLLKDERSELKSPATSISESFPVTQEPNLPAAGSTLLTSSPSGKQTKDNGGTISGPLSSSTTTHASLDVSKPQKNRNVILKSKIKQVLADPSLTPFMKKRMAFEIANEAGLTLNDLSELESKKTVSESESKVKPVTLESLLDPRPTAPKIEAPAGGDTQSINPPFDKSVEDNKDNLSESSGHDAGFCVQPDPEPNFKMISSLL